MDSPMESPISDHIHQIRQIESRISNLSSELCAHLNKQTTKVNANNQILSHSSDVCFSAISSLGDNYKNVAQHVVQTINMIDEISSRIVAAQVLLTDLEAINEKLTEIDNEL
ncbi:hypothetical protein AYI68_g8263 [Smittium mucronatum]|uniref:Uncharacterized protein n=1 Tax=Smittium mucronatum TaxID=133383 RepID=A0A1R0GLD6_9FUNG|nr:hypothetical protein AYI68_g8263 [Smittium mucronatum]